MSSPTFFLTDSLSLDSGSQVSAGCRSSSTRVSVVADPEREAVVAFSVTEHGKMTGVRRITVALLLFACIAAGPALGQTTRPKDGRPRPTGYPDTPSMSYGATPPCLLNGVAVTCEWYGFAHILYPVMGAQCMVDMRYILSNTTLVPVGKLRPYLYYFFPEYVFDTATNTSYCLYGCFDLSASSPSAPPPLSFTPPPVVSAPPPATLFPPPPVADLTPPPLLTTPPPPSSLLTPPPTSDTATPPGAALAPPPPGNTRIINLSGAAFLQPTGLLSFIISGALLLLNGLVA